MKVKNSNKLVILSFSFLVTIALTSAFNVKSTESSKVEISNLSKDKQANKSENTTINTYLEVMANYSEEEINDFFASRNVSDDTVIFAPKNSKGGFFLFEGDNTTVISENEGVVNVVDAKAPNQSATVGEVKEALKETHN
ncbi:hypothetical protein CAC02_04035 [Streptococcus gallolyticus]|uniref:Signal peptide containing protein n=1 Tax=Streptococcus gallolyticus TaxID=315405 RepID=A0A368UGG1_9STRE|nr:hypothetical protein [Streptococcus gallolyticus]RCW17296.1 hypothetical protein CAC02_04035 [Streptococcus gallolyticus]